MSELVKEFPPDEPIISICQYKDMVVIATSKRIFRMRDGNAEQVTFEVIPEDAPWPISG